MTHYQRLTAIANTQKKMRHRELRGPSLPAQAGTQATEKEEKTLGMQSPEPEATEGKTQTKFNRG
jgi:hypothetical protein